MSDFHEMVSNLRLRKERVLHMNTPAYKIDNGGRRLGIERREFNYSHYYPERRIGNERRGLPERRAETKPGAQVAKEKTESAYGKNARAKRNGS